MSSAQRKKRILVVLALSSMLAALFVISRLSAMIIAGEAGAFFVLLAVLIFLLALGGYLLFYAFGQNFLLFHAIFENANSAISIIGCDGRHVWNNKSFCDFSGNEKTGDQQASFYINTKEISLKEELERIREFSGIFKFKAKDDLVDVFISAFKVQNELGDTICYVQMMREAREYMRIVEKTRQERDRILEIAHRDHLTRLFNRNGFVDAIEQKLRDGRSGSIIFADVDNFKRINDTYGHDVGDIVLRGIGEIMKSSVRSGDIAARFGGEEFVSWVDAGGNCAFEIAEKIRQTIAGSNIESLEVTCSLGVSEVLDGAYEEAIKRADEAMYDAKKSGKNRVVKHTPGSAEFSWTDPQSAQISRD